MKVSCLGCALGSSASLTKAWRVGSAKTSAVQGAEANLAFNSADGVTCLKGFRAGIFIVYFETDSEELFDHDEFRDVHPGVGTRSLGPGTGSVASPKAA